MKNRLLFFFFLTVSISIFGCEKTNNEIYNNSNTEFTSLNTNEEKKAADFELKTLDGKNVKLSDYKGKIVIIDFWATWCAPCRKGVPDLVELQKEYKNDLVIIGVSLDQQNTIKDLNPFIKNYGINYPVVLGTQKVVMDYGNIQAIPTSFVINQAGYIVDSHVGLVPKSTYVNTINKLLKES